MRRGSMIPLEGTKERESPLKESGYRKKNHPLKGGSKTSKTKRKTTAKRGGAHVRDHSWQP
jgi:hypothetical protein